jgi:integrase
MLASSSWHRTTFVAVAHVSAMAREVNSKQIQFLLGHASVQTTERYIGCKQKLREAVNDRFRISLLDNMPDES